LSLVGALCAALATGCSESANTGSAVPSQAVFRVEPRDLRVTVTETGSLKTRNQELVRPRIPGQAKIMSLIEEGSLVKEGDVLCQLDQTDVEKEVAALETRLIQLDGELTAAKAEFEIQLSENEADIANAELKLRFADVELERYQKGEFVQEQKKREVRVEEARSSLERASRKYEQMPALLEEGFVTQAQVEEERINKVKAASEVELADLDLSTYLVYTSP
jgi:HlyD family secretion protein